MFSKHLIDNTRLDAADTIGLERQGSAEVEDQNACSICLQVAQSARQLLTMILDFSNFNNYRYLGFSNFLSFCAVTAVDVVFPAGFR